MVDFKRLFKHMKTPFQKLFGILGYMGRIEVWGRILKGVLSIVLGGLFLGLPMIIQIRYFPRYYTTEMAWVIALIETIWITYWGYVILKYKGVDLEGAF